MADLTRGRQRGQASVELGASALVLILILVGLLDLGRSFYFGVALRGATREGARVASWFDASNDNNPTLDDADIKAAVDGILAKSGLPASVLANPGTTCPSPVDGNSLSNPPYADATFGGGARNAPVLYICYANAPGTDMTVPPGDNSHAGQDVNVVLAMRFASATGLFPEIFGNIRLVANTHMTVGGYPCPC